MPKVFTGLVIPPDIGFALSLKRGGLTGARWIEPENYHITLRYIGDIDSHSADEAADMLDRYGRTEPFTLTIDHLGVFGGSKPRALYAGLAASDALFRLQAAHERALQRAGLPADRHKYVPHVTLARLRDTPPHTLARHIAQAGLFTPLTFTVSHSVLYSSRASLGGGPYTVEQEFPFDI